MPGQYAESITAETRFCGVFGHPIRHSASPPMQNAGIAALGLNWRYLAFDVRPENLREAIAGARSMHFIGLNLTVPHKLLALDIADALDHSSRTWGAVNTIRFEARQEPDGPWTPISRFDGDVPGPVRAHGFNTDADAIVQALREDLGFDPVSAPVVLLGAGGAGRVAALRLAAEGCPLLYLVNRTEAKCRSLADEIKQRYPSTATRIGYPDRADQRDLGLLLNATSLGLKESDPLPLDESRLPIAGVPAVYDMIYRPAATPLLERARLAGAKTANGLGMLLYQGTKALEIWSGRPAPEAEMRTALTKSIYGN